MPPELFTTCGAADAQHMSEHDQGTLLRNQGPKVSRTEGRAAHQLGSLHIALVGCTTSFAHMKVLHLTSQPAHLRLREGTRREAQSKHIISSLAR